MGSKPEIGHAVSEVGMDLLVLCAEEYQPPASLFQGVKVIHAPFDDTDIRFLESQKATAFAAAKQVADAMRKGSNVLVTCFAGRNRSGLVAGLALVESAYDPLWAIRLIQGRRANALTNQSFVELIAGAR
jgi:protein-tyrosine phosphatase